MYRLLPSVLVALALALPAESAWARDVLLVYGPGLPGDDAEDAARDEAGALLGAWKTRAEAVHVTEMPFFGPAPLWAVGDVAVRPCAGAARSLDEIRQLVTRGRELTDLLEDDEADRTFQSAWLALECADDFVPRDLLYEVQFYGGVSAFVAGDEARAREHFIAAVSVEPDRAFDPGYPPEIEALYVAAGEDAGGRVALSLSDPGGVATEIRVDGAALRGTAPLSIGDHLVQFRTRFDTFSSIKLRVEGDGQAVLVARDAVARSVLEPGGDGTSRVVAAEALRHLAAERGADVVIVAALESRSYRFDTVSGFAARAGRQPRPQDATVRHARQASLRRVALATTVGGMAYPTPGVIGPRMSYASFGLLGEIPLVRGLAVDLGVWVAVHGADPTTAEQPGVYLLPAARTGLHVSVGRGVVRPYFGAAFLMVLHQMRDRGEHAGAQGVPGGVGIAGIAIQPARHLRVFVDMHGGYNGAPIVQVCGGVGIRL
jgi:hypothetical protein